MVLSLMGLRIFGVGGGGIELEEKGVGVRLFLQGVSFSGSYSAKSIWRLL